MHAFVGGRLERLAGTDGKLGEVARAHGTIAATPQMTWALSSAGVNATIIAKPVTSWTVIASTSASSIATDHRLRAGGS